ncbi:hypothetical protein [Roseiflexus sp.]|uniref:hypothetical protein n=1 Tax=Roseiflexus sp. TaxID=2562120 RepID=UPI00258CCB81|nr:hypothetical protein [Roseiflexus sp.]
MAARYVNDPDVQIRFEEAALATTPYSGKEGAMQPVLTQVVSASVVGGTNEEVAKFEGAASRRFGAGCRCQSRRVAA